jgi:thiopeptide-type bacteriocin biosynthesis protein
LIREIKPLVNQLYSERLIDKFFFIRYADPHWHLRIRFKLVDPEHNMGKVTSMFYERIKGYCERKTVWKIQADQYDRELIRYGAENIENSEQIFYLDSAFALESLEVSTSEKHRWHTCMLSADQFIECFGLSLDQKVAFTKMNSLNFQDEFRANNSAARKLINEKYRLHKPEIENLFKANTVETYLLERSNGVRICSQNIERHIGKGTLSVGKENLLSSYIHMSINRVMRSKPRVYEMLIYDFLHTFYSTKLKSKKVTNREPMDALRRS